MTEEELCKEHAKIWRKRESVNDIDEYKRMTNSLADLAAQIVAIRNGNRIKTKHMKPTIGRIVHYTLSAQDANEINRRRTSAYSIAERIGEDKWPLGAQAHIGNQAYAGTVLPMIITAVFSETLISGQVFLDGNDTIWKTSIFEGEAEGFWKWPARD